MNSPNEQQLAELISAMTAASVGNQVWLNVYPCTMVGFKMLYISGTNFGRGLARELNTWFAVNGFRITGTGWIVSHEFIRSTLAPVAQLLGIQVIHNCDASYLDSPPQLFTIYNNEN